MSNKTIAEKILSRSSGTDARAGDIVICRPDLAMATDGSLPMAIDYLADMGPVSMKPECPAKIVVALDHYNQSSGPKALALQAKARAYAKEFGLVLYDSGQGVGHQLILESGKIKPGMLIVGADSHSTTYGALNCFATGIGSSDLAGILLCGSVWLRVPETIKISFRGSLRNGVSGKDVALHLAGQFEGGKANYCCLEFDGDGLGGLRMEDRIVIANMAVEYGAKSAAFPFDSMTAPWVRDGGADAVRADDHAEYSRTMTVDLSTLQPQIARPHSVDNVSPIADSDRVPVDVVYIGTCTAGRYEDFLAAFRIIDGNGGIAPGVKLFVTPASMSVQDRLEREGILDRFTSYGAVLQPPGCGSCCGTAGYRPMDGEVVVSTANRNFKGRMGNVNASIYLASPETCARAACAGYIARRET